MNNKPHHLRINNRQKLTPDAFTSDDKLYHAYSNEDYDQSMQTVKVETIRFPDFSCNWSRFSSPKDVLDIKNRPPTDGCYSFSVDTARYKNIATPVHDPIEEPTYENYSHVEVRLLKEEDDRNIEPPKNNKPSSKKYKKLRLEYRTNLANNLIIEFEPKC